MAELIGVGMAGFITTKVVKALGEKDIADIIWALTLAMAGVVFVTVILPDIVTFFDNLPDKMGKALYDILLYPIRAIVDYFTGGNSLKELPPLPQLGGSSGTW